MPDENQGDTVRGDAVHGTPPGIAEKKFAEDERVRASLDFARQMDWLMLSVTRAARLNEGGASHDR